MVRIQYFLDRKPVSISMQKKLICGFVPIFEGGGEQIFIDTPEPTVASSGEHAG